MSSNLTKNPKFIWLSLGWLVAWRWCLVGWAFLVGFPVLAWVAPSLLEAAFDVRWWGMFFVSLSVFFLCFSLRLLGTVVVAYGPERMDLPQTGWVKKIRNPSGGIVGYLLWSLLGLPSIVMCVHVSSRTALPGQGTDPVADKAQVLAPLAELAQVQGNIVIWLSFAAVLGWLAALVFYTFVLWVHRRAPHASPPGNPDEPLYRDPEHPKCLAALFAKSAARSAAKTTVQTAAEKAAAAAVQAGASPAAVKAAAKAAALSAAKAAGIPSFSLIDAITGFFGGIAPRLFGTEGYCHPVTGKLHSGHRLAILMALAFVLLYIFIQLLGSSTIGVPVLVYLTILVSVVVWWLNLLSFALDRFRIPVILVLLGIMLILRLLPERPYTFRAEREKNPTAEKDVPDPVDILNDDYAVIVAAEGGGIHSGAWATHVLRMLEKECRDQNVLSGGTGDSFAKHVVCVSGVSGGSYGLMYWVDSYGREGGPADPLYNEETTFQLTEARAIRSSLEASIRGLVYHDIWKTFSPIVPGMGDRGSLLEEEWVKPPSGVGTYNNPLANATMASWRKDAMWDQEKKARVRPAVLFNSMNADTGQPVVFSTTRLADDGESPLWEYTRQRPGEDVPVVTAARCSASFPFVCPAAAPATDQTAGMHLVDGGYYDNFGMASLNRWLTLALKRWEHAPPGTAKFPKRLLVVQVRASSESLFPQMLSPKWKAGGSTPFLYQVTVPLTGLLNMRGAAQIWHNDQEFTNIYNRLKELGVDVRNAVFRFPGMDNPLSWHLTTSQKQAVRNVNFNKPQKESTAYNPEKMPRSDEEKTKWAEWTRYRAQIELFASWEQVAQHFHNGVPAAK